MLTINANTLLLIYLVKCELHNYLGIKINVINDKKIAFKLYCLQSKALLRNLLCYTSDKYTNFQFTCVKNQP